MAELIYGEYITREIVKENKQGGEGIGLTSVPQDIIPAVASMHLGTSIIRKPYMFHEPTHKHIFTEYFYFFGSNPMDMQQFDADVDKEYLQQYTQPYTRNTE